MNAVAKLALLCLGLAGPVSSLADVLWLCTVSTEDARLVCVSEDDPAADASSETTTTAVVNGTRFPLDPRRVYAVDMWTQPTDQHFAEELAQATLCYRTANCRTWLHWHEQPARVKFVSAWAAR